MANTLTGNPIHADSAGTLWTSQKGDSAYSYPKKVRLIQWIDDNGDLVHDSTLVLTINGVALTAKIQPVNDQLGFGAVAWQIGPFNPGIPIHTFIVTTMGTGHLHVWIE